jgi:predicted DNA-binding transcriptional regulator AlpA
LLILTEGQVASQKPKGFRLQLKTQCFGLATSDARGSKLWANVTNGVPTMRNTPQPIPPIHPHQDKLVRDRAVAEEFGDVSLMTLYRWTNDTKLGFPPPVKIRNKNFRSRRALEEFKARLMHNAIRRRAEAK